MTFKTEHIYAIVVWKQDTEYSQVYSQLYLRIATRKPPCEREIEIDHKFLARRWVIYACIHVEVSGN